MKNILAENLLRFGVKNLKDVDKTKLSEALLTEAFQKNYCGHVLQIGALLSHNAFLYLLNVFQNSKLFQKYSYVFMNQDLNTLKTFLINNKVPILCPLETIIILHMINLYKDGRFSDITIMDIYSIIYYFDECSNSLDDTHNYNCLCKTKFNDINDDFDKHKEIRNSIINHYNKTIQINTLYETHSAI
jgi:hypothetical protein